MLLRVAEPLAVPVLVWEELGVLVVLAALEMLALCDCVVLDEALRVCKEEGVPVCVCEEEDVPELVAVLVPLTLVVAELLVVRISSHL